MGLECREDRQFGPFSTRDEYHKGAVKALCYARPKDKLTKHDGLLVKRIIASRSQDEERF
jgi:hypothetical protein